MEPEKKKQKVLVVGDDPEMQIFLSTVLETGGFIPLIAENSQDPIKTAMVENPALIILDVMMSGKENLYHTIRQDKNLKNIPVIMLSALSKSTVFHFQKYQSPSFGYRVPEPEAYIEKPPEADELLNIVNRLLTG